MAVSPPNEEFPPLFPNAPLPSTGAPPSPTTTGYLPTVILLEPLMSPPPPPPPPWRPPPDPPPATIRYSMVLFPETDPREFTVNEEDPTFKNS
jgi:hypothetical protein